MSAPPVDVDVQVLAELQFPVPSGAAESKYLGLSGTGSFKLGQIAAETVIVEVFSMYCPICQAAAPAVNEFYDFIEKNPALKGKIKLVGIGIGNTPFEVDVYRKKYNVRFPLVPDDDFRVEKGFAEQVRTPTFVVLKKGKDGKLEAVYTQKGEFKSRDDLLKKLPGQPAAK